MEILNVLCLAPVGSPSGSLWQTLQPSVRSRGQCSSQDKNLDLLNSEMGDNFKQIMWSSRHFQKALPFAGDMISL